MRGRGEWWVIKALLVEGNGGILKWVLGLLGGSCWGLDLGIDWSISYWFSAFASYFVKCTDRGQKGPCQKGGGREHGMLDASCFSLDPRSIRLANSMKYELFVSFVELPTLPLSFPSRTRLLLSFGFRVHILVFGFCKIDDSHFFFFPFLFIIITSFINSWGLHQGHFYC